jgi:predicted CXXCH cytochrome family protein
MPARSTHRMIGVVASLLVLVVLVAACAGPEGTEGPQGPAGPPGPQGPAGPPAESGGAVANYVGSEVCAQCHQSTYESFMQTGHPHQLTQVVDGQPPEYPFTQVPDPPEGYTWDDVSYVVGGFARKAQFIDQDGYLITGDAQYNLENEVLHMGPEWVSFHAGESELSYDCGACHTTGYRANGNQNDLPGITGTWALDGVQCEACHGPASAHVQDPTRVRPVVNTDSSLCLGCHTQDTPALADESGTFISAHESYPDVFVSKHAALDCVDCHNPHATTHYRDNGGVSESGINTACVSCHWQQETFYPQQHLALECTHCHMARTVVNTYGDPETLTGDFPSHMFAVNPFEEQQFVETDEGLVSQNFTTVPYACSTCHSENGLAGPMDPADLYALAQGYHDRDRAGQVGPTFATTEGE